MNFSFQDLIKEIESVKNYLKEKQENLPVTGKVSELLKIDRYEARILCNVFYSKMVKFDTFDNDYLKRKVDIRDKDYLLYIKAIEKLYVKKLIVFKENYDSEEGHGKFFNTDIRLSRKSFSFFMYGEIPSFKEEKINNAEELADYIMEVFMRVSDLNAPLKPTYDYLEAQLSDIGDRLADGFPLVNIVKKLPFLEIVLLGLLLHNFSQKGNVSMPLNRLTFSKAGRVLKIAFFVPGAFEKTELHKHNLVAQESSEVMSGQTIALTTKALKGFFGISKSRLLAFSQLTEVSGIKKKELFFNKDVENGIKQIEEVLSQGKYKRFCSLSIKSGLKPSIIVLLYGEPGTGKTEFVSQVARRTKRRLLKLDVAKSISKWIGESEKNIRTIFEEYKKSLNVYDRHPILLLNEADSFLSERISVNDSTDQTYNDLRNIFLEEMENFEGILFATTNLVDGIDTAFFRRFNFKFLFRLPEKEVRAKIWKSKKPDLSDRVIEKLSYYPLSGGDIENVIKGLVVARVVNPRLKEEEVLLNLVRSEAEVKAGLESRTTLGFRVV